MVRKKVLILVVLAAFLSSGCIDYIKKDLLEWEEREEESIWPDIEKMGGSSPEKSPAPNAPEGGSPISPSEPQYDIPLQINGKVEKFIRHYRGPDKKWFAKVLNRSGRYIPGMREVFREKGLPQDLAYLAAIESGYSPYCSSKAGAVGVWQFIRGTARHYGMTVGWWIDERRDPWKATAAAADYLKDLYEIFDSWPLALAAYNAGDARVRKALKKSRTGDFWSLQLPRETREFVPRYMASLTIAKNPGKYGFSPVYDPQERSEEVLIKEATDLRIIADACQSSLKEIKGLNPALKRWVTPPGYSSFPLRIPYGSKEQFRINFSKIPRDKKITWQRHRVKRGETLWGISRKYKTTIQVIMELNFLKRSSYIREGWNLIVPVGVRTYPSF